MFVHQTEKTWLPTEKTQRVVKVLRSSLSVSGSQDKATMDQHQYFFLICFMSNPPQKEVMTYRV